MRKQVVTCDQCGKQKQDTNRWWTIARIGGALIVSAGTTINVVHGGQTPDVTSDLCGEQCVTAYLAKKMAEVV